jgi:hypothetical protein
MLLFYNITARARCDVWKLAKPLNLAQSITDGGAYSLMDVFFFKENLQKLRKPGFDQLSNVKELRKHKYIKAGPLGGQEWI